MGFFSSLFEGSGKSGKRLIETAKSGTIEQVKRLLAERIDTSAHDKHGWTALMHACWHGRFKVVELLLKHGADVNAADHNGWTALMRASGNGHGGVVELLIEQAAC